MSRKRIRLRGVSSAPIEMRFVDMFMAAIGALLFMSMLFAFLIGGNAKPCPVCPEFRSYQPLKLLNRTLPEAQVGRNYFAPIAYRDGRAPVSFQVVKSELPKGLSFDSEQGAVTGMPTEEGEGSIVLVASDNVGPTSTKALLIKVTPGEAESPGKVGLWILIASAIFFALMALAGRSNERSERELLSYLVERFQNGDTEVYVQQHAKTYHLPESLETLTNSINAARGATRFFTFLSLASVGGVIWKLVT